jgi:membrane-associated protease RseP (regulator of RpoE activity)
MNKENKRIVLQVGLFIATFFTSTIAGAEFCLSKTIFNYPEVQKLYEGLFATYRGPFFNPSYTWSDFLDGTQFSIPFLLILTVHEFGHYFTAMYHRVKCSLPYYIPIPPMPFFQLLGTMGAVIRIRSKVRTNFQNFDIGLAGPLAGFIVALAVLYYGFATLPPPEYVFQFHPEYEKYGLNYADVVYSAEYLKEGATDLQLGDNLLMSFFSKVVADPARIPNPHEMMHYPVLVAGFFALFFTALNLLPIGQLDGGHITYGLFGRKGHSMIASVFFLLFIFYAGLGFVKVTDPNLSVWVPVAIFFNYLCFRGMQLNKRTTAMFAFIVFAVQFVLTAVYPNIDGYSGWLLFGLLIGRFVGVHHPPSEIEVPLDPKRIVLGWVMLAIFILCFTPAPVIIKVLMPADAG